MIRLSDYRMRFVFVGVVAALVLGDGGHVKADYTFGEVTNLGPAFNSPDDDGHPSVSSDGLELYFDSLRPGGSGGSDLWVSTRTATDANWSTPANLGLVVNSSAADWAPNISADGLTLYFSSNRPDGSGSHDIWMTSRPVKHADWGTPVNLGPTINFTSFDWAPLISADGLVLYFSSNRTGGSGSHDIWVSTRHTINGDWGAPVNLGTLVNSENWDGVGHLLPDGRTLLFGSMNRLGGAGAWDIWITSRPTIRDDWGEPASLPEPVNTAFAEGGLSLSGDGETLYLSSDRPAGLGSQDIWQVPVEPVVDLNGNGIVDAADMCIIVEHWGTDHSLCDIGPTPWGDGIVDVEDLIVLAEHLFEEFPPFE